MHRLLFYTIVQNQKNIILDVDLTRFAVCRIIIFFAHVVVCRDVVTMNFRWQVDEARAAETINSTR